MFKQMQPRMQLPHIRQIPKKIALPVILNITRVLLTGNLKTPISKSKLQDAIKTTTMGRNTCHQTMSCCIRANKLQPETRKKACNWPFLQIPLLQGAANPPARAGVLQWDSLRLAKHQSSWPTWLHEALLDSTLTPCSGIGEPWGPLGLQCTANKGPNMH